MNYQYTISEAEYFQIQWLVQRTSPRMNAILKQRRILLTAMMGVLGVLFILQGDSPIGIGFLIAAGITFVLIPPLDRSNLQRQLKRLNRERYHAAFDQPVALEVTEQMVLERQSGIETQVSPNGILKVIESPKYTVLLLHNGNWIFFPHYKIAAEEEFRKQLQAWCKQFQIPHHLESKD